MDHVSSLKDLTERLEHLQSCNDLLTKRGTGLQRAISDLETQEPISHELSAKVKALSERATLFRVAASAMITVSWFHILNSWFQSYRLNSMQLKETDDLIDFKLFSGKWWLFTTSPAARTQMEEDASTRTRSKSQNRKNGGTTS